MVVSEVVGTLSFLKPQADDDFVDRLHYYYTSTFLLVAAVLMSLKMFGGRPIECWVPAEYRGGWEDYTEMFCWARNTYWVSFDEDIPEDVSSREERMISYYQWTPFFFVICAFLFYAPCLIWRIMYDKSGFRIKDIMAFATDQTNIQPANRRANIQGLAAHLSTLFRHSHRFCVEPASRQRYLNFINFRYCNAYLTSLYIFIKFLYLCNLIGQMFILNHFLQTDRNSFYGVEVIKDLVSGRPWSESGNFPRITLCDLKVRILGNVQRHTVQCVLVINIFTEKIFMLLWIWYCFLALISICSFLSWFSSSISMEERKRFIARRLELADVEFKKSEHILELDEFVVDYVRLDGIFVLKLLTIHAGMVMCTEVVDKMWDDFLTVNEKKEKLKGAEMLPVLHSEEATETGRKHSVVVPLVTTRETDDTLNPLRTPALIRSDRYKPSVP